MKYQFVRSFLSVTAIFLLSLFIPLNTNAQQTKIDSLKKELLKPMHDTLRMKLMSDIGYEYFNINTDSALVWWNSCYKFGEDKLKNCKGLECNRLLKLSGDVTGNIGFIYVNRGAMALALDYAFMSLHIHEKINDKHGIAQSYNSIAFLFSQQRDTTQALAYYEKSEAGYKAIGDSGGVAYTQINRAKIYMQQHKDDKAMSLFMQAINKLSDTQSQYRGLASCLNNMGVLFTRSGKYKEADEYLHRGLNLRMRYADFSAVSGSYASIALMHQAQKTNDSAFYYATKAYELAKQNRNKEVIVSSAGLLSELYKAKNDFRKAFEYYTIQINARDTLANEESGKKLIRQQMSYEYAKKTAQDSLEFVREKELDQLKLERQRDYTIGGFAGLGIVAILLFFVYRQRNSISREKKRSDKLLLNILPAETAEELKETGTAKTKKYEQVTVMFTDFKNFTKTAELLTAEELVALINTCYGEFDRIVSRHHVEKIKTIGDSYMCVGGLPVKNNSHAVDAVKAAIEMIDFIRTFNAERIKQNLPFFDIRIGLHTGPVVAGIVGINKFAYDIWGDTVNIASRMESSGEPGRINISGATYELVKTQFSCTHRGKIQAKNKGEIDMYFVDGGEN
jgi:adenylate cyclase